MGSHQEKKPHVVCIRVPLQGHINPMLKLAKILHSKGFLITFVNTEFNHQRLLRSQGLDALDGLPSFRFETIPDGLPPPENTNASQDIPTLAKSVDETCLGPFKSLVAKVNESYAPVACIVADVLMGFTFAAATELGIPEIALWTSGAASLICYNQYPKLLENKLMPLKDLSYLVNGYLDTVIDCVPAMSGIRLKDIPPFVRILFPGDEYMVQFMCSQVERAKKASAIIYNTFDELEHDVLDSLASMYPPCYGIGPLHLLERNIGDKSLASMKSNLWIEEAECLKWLDLQAPLSVIYVNFDPSYLVNGYLDTIVDFIPSMPGICLKDIPPFVRIVHPGDEFIVGFSKREIEGAKRATAIIFNTFDELDGECLDALSLKYSVCYSIGPLHLFHSKIVDNSLDSIKSNLWVEDPKCLKWLDDKEPFSVVYVNFGSITVMTPQQLVEFCWGLAKSNYSFLWIIRPDLVVGDSAILPPEFVTETSGRGMLVGWCPQEQVLNHPSIGGFLTHSGWNSTLESISSGVPMICWPFFADQQTNCWWSCNKWGVAMEIDNNVKSDEVSKLVIELMEGEKGKEMRKNAIDLKNKAEKACTSPSGSSMVNLEKVIQLIHSFSK